MGRLLRTLVAVLLPLSAACGGDRGNDPPSSPPPSNGGQTITGRERFGWTQTAPSASELAQYRYALYVDGSRRVVEGETCSAITETSFDCSAPLPALSPGRHTLELAVFIEADGEIVESPRSPALQVNVAAVTAPADDLGFDSGTIESSDGLALRVDVVTRDLDYAVDAAAAPDGRVFIAERRGSVRVFDPRRGAISAEDHPLRMLSDGADAELASIALAPDFDETNTAYLAFRLAARDGTRLGIARLREAGSRFGQAAVIATYAVPPDATAIARVGPDGMLHVGIGTGRAADNAQQLSEAPGKILRLDPAGRTPDGNPWQSPVFSLGHRAPQGLAWHPLTRALWEVESGDELDEVNVIRGGANYGWPIVNGVARHPRVTSPVLLLPQGTEPSGLAAIVNEAHPLYGELVVAARQGRDLLRVRIFDSGEAQVVGRLLQQRFGPIAQVTADSAGTLYAIASNTTAQNQDTLLRIAVVR